MKKGRIFVRVVLVILVIFSCDNSQELNKTANKFALTIIETNISRAEYIRRLQPFMEPSSNVDSLCSDYYRHWKSIADYNCKVSDVIIEKIEKKGNDSAVVYISDILSSAAEGRYYDLSITYWKWNGKKWFRTGDLIEHKKLENERIVQTTDKSK